MFHKLISKLNFQFPCVHFLFISFYIKLRFPKRDFSSCIIFIDNLYHSIRRRLNLSIFIETSPIFSSPVPIIHSISLRNSKHSVKMRIGFSFVQTLTSNSPLFWKVISVLIRHFLYQQLSDHQSWTSAWKQLKEENHHVAQKLQQLYYWDFRLFGYSYNDL